MKSVKLELLLEKARSLRKSCEVLNKNEIFFMLQHQLNAAIAFSEEEKQKRPLIITLMGGTGVGKSFIFSTLCGFSEASPSSSSVRGFTRQLFIAASEEDRMFLPFSTDEAHFLPGVIPGVVLIDTPDLDTIHDNNARLASQTISASDILVCVTTPDKRSDFVINRSVAEWASRKRWFFVMNKIDTVPEVPEDSLRTDLNNRLQTIGFKIEPSAGFVFSARQPDSAEFKRFRETIVSTRTVSQNGMLKQEACCRQLLHALGSNRSTELMLKIYQQLNGNRELLRERIIKLRQETAASDTLSGIASDALTATLYRELASNSSLFLFPWFAALNWLTRSVSARSAELAVKRALTGNQNLLACYADERRFLEDAALCNDDRSGEEADHVPAVTGEIYLQITDRAQKAADSRLLRFYVIVGNLLPAMILIQALYRAVASWLTGVWLPADFFIHAIFLIVIATLPGYLLLAKAITRISRSFVLHAPTNTPELKQLDAKIAQIEQVLQEASLMNNSAEGFLKELHAQLPDRNFGISGQI